MESMLSPKQIIAASAIAIGKSKKEAAEAAEVTPQTISKWMQIPEFEAALNSLKLASLNEAQDRIRGLGNDATLALACLLKESKNEKIRLEAAKYILDKINIAPSSKDPGLWFIGPTSTKDVVKLRKLKDNPNLSLLGNMLD